MAPSSPPVPPDALPLAIQAARAAGAVLVERLGQVRQIHHKGEIDLVTEVDLEAEHTVVEIIRRRFPDHRILAEEGSVGAAESEYRWVVDPLDGTTNYSHGFPFFCVSIGLEVGERVDLGVVYDPLRDELFEARRGQRARLNDQPIQVSATTSLGQSLLATGFPYNRALFPQALRHFEALSLRCLAVRRMGSAALALCYVAAGRLDGYWELTTNAWDAAAGSLLVTEAGGMVSGVAGEPLDIHRPGVLASAPGVYRQVLEALAVR